MQCVFPKNIVTIGSNLKRNNIMKRTSIRWILFVNVVMMSSHKQGTSQANLNLHLHMLTYLSQNNKAILTNFTYQL